MDVGFTLLFLLFAAAVIAAGIFAHFRAEERRTKLAALAGRLGWSFVSASDPDHQDEYEQFELFRRGHSRYAYNTLTGHVDLFGHSCRARMGDYHYKVTSNSGKSTSTQTYHFSYMVVDLPYRGVPPLLIRREGMLDAFKSALGFADIDFESAEFSRKYFVKSGDKRFAYDVIHPPVMEYLLAREGPAIDIEQGCCCLANGSSVWSPEEFEQYLEWLRGFFALWPQHVIATLVRC